MNTDNDFYQNTDYKYTEIGIAKTNFTYGGRVDIYIPTITPFKSGKSEDKISYDCIVNDDKSFIGNGKSSKCASTNTLRLVVPHYLADYVRSPGRTHYCHECGAAISQPHEDMVKYNWNGTAGTKFIISFVGGNINNAQIIGRYYE